MCHGAYVEVSGQLAGAVLFSKHVTHKTFFCPTSVLRSGLTRLLLTDPALATSSSVLGLQACPAMSSFCVGAGELNSSLLAFTASALTTELSLQP